jgi:hypothetical protein
VVLGVTDMEIELLIGNELSKFAEITPKNVLLVFPIIAADDPILTFNAPLV